MENLTWTATTASGNEYEHVAYSDPYPGRKGSERIRHNCGWCGGTGLYQGPSGHKFYTPAVGANDTGCFHCEGRGYNSVLVSSLRAAERRRINRENERRATAADVLANMAQIRAEELATAWDAAHAEQARREAKPKGFLAEVGTRVRNLEATVLMVRTFESANYVTGAPELKSVVKFQVEGKTATWFTSYTVLEEGDRVTLSGTVKKHETYKGEDQTVLTRCIVK